MTQKKDILTQIKIQLKNSIPNSQIIRDHRSNSITLLSTEINQIVYVKYSRRKAPITRKLAKQYLVRSLREISRMYPCQRHQMYVLNVFIADNLLNTCFDIRSVGRPRFKTFNMVFSTKYMSCEDIIFVILRSISSKLRSWNKHVRENCKVEPYGSVKDRVEFVDKTIDLCDLNAWHVKNKKNVEVDYDGR